MVLWVVYALLVAAWVVQFDLMRYSHRLWLACGHRHLDFPAIDFYQDWAAGRDFMRGDSIYTPLAQNQSVHAPHLGLPEVTEPILALNGHPPTMTLLVLGLARLEYASAFRIWSWLGLAFLAGSVYMVLRGLQPGLSRAATLGATALLSVALTSSFPVERQFELGNVHMLLLLLVTGAWAAERSGRPGWAGVLIGVATAAKLYPGFLVLYFVVARRWRAVAGAALGFGVLTAATAAVLGPGVYVEFVEKAMPEVATYRSDAMNASVAALWHKLFNAGPRDQFVELAHAPIVAWGLIALCCLSLVWACLRMTRGEKAPPRADLAFGLAVITMLLVSPVTWPHGQCLLLVPVAVMWKYLRIGSPAHWVVVLATAVLWLDVRANVQWRLHPAGEAPVYRVWEALTWTSLGLYATLALWVVGALAIQRAGKSPGHVR